MDKKRPKEIEKSQVGSVLIVSLDATTITIISCVRLLVMSWEMLEMPTGVGQVGA